MTSYYAKTRSNYFTVTAPKAFQEMMESLEVETWQNEQGQFAISSEQENGWPSYDDEEEEDINFPQIVSCYLEQKQVAILFEIGSEGKRYLIGQAIAVNSLGEETYVGLSEIYKHAEQMGENVTHAEY